jgi:hypothetical protein
MPFTPFHFGPGAAIKAVAPRYFSFTVFCFAQVATDCETAYYMVQGEYPLHRFFHTYCGATLVAVFSIIVGRPICQFILRVWSHGRDLPFKDYFPTTTVIPWTSAATGAFLGTYSNVFLDSIMHSDIMPFAPFSTANRLYLVVGPGLLHLLCLILGVLGAFYIASRNRGTR